MNVYLLSPCHAEFNLEVIDRNIYLFLIICQHLSEIHCPGACTILKQGVWTCWIFDLQNLQILSHHSKTLLDQFHVLHLQIDGLFQDSIDNGLELLQSCTKPSIYFIENLRKIFSPTMSTLLLDQEGEVTLPGDHYWYYHPGALSESQVIATHLKIGTRRWNLRVPDLQTSCNDLTTSQETRIAIPAMAVRWPALFF